MVGLYSLPKKRKVIVFVTIYEQTNFRRAESYRNKASFSQPMMHHLWKWMYYFFNAIRGIPRGYEILRSWIPQEQFSYHLSPNNAGENYRKYQKKQGSTIIMAWSLLILEWWWYRSPSAPTLTTQTDFWQITYRKTLHSLMPMLPHQEPRNRLLVTSCFYCWISF